MAGYPLEIAGVACLGALSCGPSTTPGDGGGSGSSGYVLTSSVSQTQSTAADSTGPSSDPSTSSVDGSSSTGSTGLEGTVCPNPGEVCDEFLVCQCSCDTDPECCTCEREACTQDDHCGEDEICSNVTPFGSGWECVPSICESSNFSEVYIQDEQDVIRWGGEACLSRIEISDSSLTDLSGLAGLSFVHQALVVDANELLTSLTGLESVSRVGVLMVSDNAALTSIDGLAGLEAIGDSGQIINNPMLDRAEIDAWLVGIEGGDTALVCGNLNDAPC